MKKKLNVLIVEDSPDDARLLLAELRRAGFEPQATQVETEADFLVGIQKLPDIILSDYSLPKFSGLRAAELLRGSGLNIPFILVSGTVGEEVAVEAMRQGISDYLLKDRIARLGSAVERALADKAIRDERHRSVEALRESERFNRATLDALDAHLAVLNEKGVIIAANQAWHRFGQANSADWQAINEGTNYFSVIENAAKEDKGAFETLNGLRKVMAGTQPSWWHEYPCHSPTEKRWYCCRVTRFPGDGPVRVVVAHENITAQKKNELEILRLSRIYAALSRINEAIVTMSDRKELFTSICRALVELGGFRMAWIGWLDNETQLVQPVANWGDHTNYTSKITIYADDRPEGRGPTGKAIRENRYHVCNDFVDDPDTLPWREQAARAGFQSTAALPIHQAGVVCGAIAVYSVEAGFFQEKEIGLLVEAAKDVSFAIDSLAREAARKQAEESNARLATAVEQSAEAVVIADTSARILYVNPAFEKITGYTRAEALGLNPRFLTSGEMERDFYRQLWEVLRRGEVWRGHFINQRKDGELYEEDAIISPVRDASGKVINYVAVKRDVTHEVQLAAQLRQAQKMEGIGLLAGGIAHDFNNVLCALMMQAELALKSEDNPKEVRKGLQGIVANTQRAASLTRQLLLFSRKQVMQPSQLDLNEIVTSLTTMLSRIVREDVQLQLNLSSSPLIIHADAGMLDQLLMNLVVNARDAMAKGGRLILETAEEQITENQAAVDAEASPGRFVCLTVSDTGCGMPPEIQSRIFEPFFTTKEAGKGTGLGLATVFGIVKQHGGWIKVHSVVGKGTTFKVFLPASIHTAKEVLNAEKGQHKPHGGSETILVVEDDAYVRSLTRQILEQIGYRVLEASNGLEAQQVWTDHQDRIDLLLTDLIMPGGVDGRELAALLQQKRPELKVILTSGYSEDIAGREIMLPTGQIFIQKPCPPDRFLEDVRNLLDS